MGKTSFKDRVCVVTGGANGMGREFVLQLAGEGARVAACDLDEQGLSALRGALPADGSRTLLCKLDVGDAAARAGFIQQVRDALGPIDLLVNNAGVGACGPFDEIAGDDWLWLRGINLDAPIDFMRLVLPQMRERRSGHILNVASAAGFFAQPYLSTYVATKHALVGLSRSLHLELKPDGVSVTVACPGVVRTSILDRVRTRSLDVAEARPLFRLGLDAPRAVRRMLAAARRGCMVVIPNHDWWLAWRLYRLWPWPWDAFLARLAHFAFERQRRRRPPG